MSTFKAWILCAALGLAPAAISQPAATATMSPPDAQDQSQEPVRPAIASIVVAEIDSLPKAVRKEVDAQISHTSDSDLKALRQALVAFPAAHSALRAKGKDVGDVVAAALSSDGALLLVTTTEV